MARVAFVIGNSEERKQLDLYSLRPHGFIVGCNAIYRDFDPDLIVANDAPMYEELKANWEGPRATLRHDNQSRSSWALIDDTEEILYPFFQWWDSGKSAAWLAHVLNPDLERMYLIGFDFWGDPTPKTNDNVYKGTANYHSAERPHNHDPAWAVKWNKVLDLIPAEKYRVGEPKPYLKQLNAELITYDEFKTAHLVSREAVFGTGRLGDGSQCNKACKRAET